MDRGWPHNFERKIGIRSKTHRRKAAPLKQNGKEEKEILPFVTQYQPLVCTIKEAPKKKCNLIQVTNHYLANLTLGSTSKIMPPTMVQEDGRWKPSPEFLTCCRIPKRFCLHWKAFDLFNKVRYILWMVALLEACDVTNNGRILCRYLGFYEELEIRLKQREMVIA